MASLEDIVAATRILDKESETLMGASSSKPEENRSGFLSAKKDDDGSSTAFVGDKRVIENEAVVAEPTDQSDSGLDFGLVDQGRGKVGVENLSSVSNGGTSLSVNGIVHPVDANGSSDVLGSEKKLKDTEDSCLDDGESGPGEYKQSNGTETEGLCVDGIDKEEGSCEKLIDKDHGFSVGDFVWGKIKSHPWWPGQIYDPKDASEFAVKHSQEGRLLVAFFGDGSCSWCLPNQLMPFVENFAEKSTDSSSKSFLNAVQMAINEVGRLVEGQMTCKCIPEERKDGLVRPLVMNAGIRAGVLVPEIDVHRLSIPKYEPSELLDTLRHFAENVYVGNGLELAVLRSSLSAFYRFKGGCQLPLHQEPIYIEGLEDKNKTVDAAANDLSVPIEVPVLGPQDDEWISSPRASTAKPHGSSDDKIYHRRKQKSVAELMADNTNAKPNSHSKRKGITSGKSANSEKTKRSDGKAKGGAGQRASSSGKKRKIEVIDSPQINTEDGEPDGVDGMHEDPSPGKRREIEVAAVENASGDSKEELEMVSSPRERKKSKYLSPPYTDLSWRVGSPSSLESQKLSKIARVGDRVTKAAGEILASSPISDSVDKESEEKTQLEKLDTSARTVENDENLTFSVSDVNMPVDELLSNVQCAAVDPLYLSKEGSLDMVWAFVSALRSSTHSEGSYYKVFHKCKSSKKRKSLPRLGNLLKDLSISKKAKLEDQETPKVKKIEGKSGTPKSSKASKSRNTTDKVEGRDSPCLILTFTPGFPLPSKQDIVELFSKFGSLKEKEISVVKDSRSARIIFAKDSDAEAAFRSSLTQSPFGFDNVNYKLLRSSAGSKSRPKASQPHEEAPAVPDSSSPADDLISDVRGLNHKLEIMTAILENYHSRFSQEDKSSLKDEIKSLGEKIEATSERVSVLAEKTSLYSS